METIGKAISRRTQLWRRISQESATAAVSTRHISSSPVDIEATLKKRLEGRVAIITGGAGAIGAATSKLFVAHGAKVVIADVNEEAGRKVAHDIGTGVLFKRTDVTSEHDIESTVAFAVAEFGQLDIMYNNAGISTPLEMFQDLDMEAYDRHTSILVRGVVCGIKHAARAMIPNKKGVILNTASTASVAVASAFPLVYSISKMNIPGLTKIASWQLARHNIRVNSISPHGIPSGLAVEYLRSRGSKIDYETMAAGFASLSPLPNRHCTKEDIANAALYFCSDESSYVSGQNLVIDAGFCDKVDYDPMELGDPLKKWEEPS